MFFISTGKLKEAEIGAQFHQCSMYSFFAHRAQKRKKDYQVISLFTLSGSRSVKPERKYVGEIEPGKRDQRNVKSFNHFGPPVTLLSNKVQRLLNFFVF